LSSSHRRWVQLRVRAQPKRESRQYVLAGSQELIHSVVSLAGTAATVGPASVIYSLGRPRLTLPVNVVLAVSVIAGSLCGLHLGARGGCRLGYAMTYWGTCPVWLLQTRVDVRAGAAARGLLNARTTQ